MAPDPNVREKKNENAKDRAEGGKQHDKLDAPRMTSTAYKAVSYMGIHTGSITPVENGAPLAPPNIAPSLETFCRILDDKWPSLLYGEAWMPSRRSGAIQRKWNMMASTWHKQREYKIVEGMNMNLRRRCV